MPVKEIFTCVFKYTQAVEVIHKKNTVRTQFISPARLTCAAKIKEKILTHICYRVNINSDLGTWSQLSYIGQDVRKIPPVLSKLYGSRVQSLDLSYNCLTSLQELSNFPHLNELVLDNNQLTDSITFPRNENLRTLSLNKNNITDLDVLMRKLENNLPNLRYLSLLGNKACPNQLSSPDKDDEDYQRYSLKMKVTEEKKLRKKTEINIHLYQLQGGMLMTIEACLESAGSGMLVNILRETDSF
ncbi:leucine-rich melanocyte differentiation-associated protein-like isoform X3 [Lycorma delicatula]|uniref:leucine-rich melanocyte differentiation-associated protein-like isoform X3 n=1 Tax=Lycorma delicatula TaxID=130591 RepID=UPI003F50F7C1